MPKYPNLKNAPITEAAIEFRFPSKVDFESLQSLCPELEEKFPKSKIIRHATVDLTFKKDEPASSVVKDLDPEFIILYSKDEDQVIQLKSESFSFSWVSKYTNWEEFSGKALELWNKANQILKADKINRIGARFINNLNLPEGIALREFIVNSPSPPTNTVFEIAGFFNQMTLYDRETSISALVSLGLDRNKIKGQSLPVIFDIDVFHLGNIPNENKIINEKFTRLRNFKNSIFFNSLTSKGVKLYQ